MRATRAGSRASCAALGTSSPATTDRRSTGRTASYHRRPVPAAASAAATAPVAPAAALSADEARRIALRAQGMIGAPDRRGGVPAMLHALGAVQLDTISVLARSHELVAYARLGPVGRAAVERAYWSGDAFEYWSHAASILPLTEWPWFAFRRRRLLARQKRWHDVHQH